MEKRKREEERGVVLIRKWIRQKIPATDQGLKTDVWVHLATRTAWALVGT